MEKPRRLFYAFLIITGFLLGSLSWLVYLYLNKLLIIPGILLDINIPLTPATKGVLGRDYKVLVQVDAMPPKGPPVTILHGYLNDTRLFLDPKHNEKFREVVDAWVKRLEGHVIKYSFGTALHVSLWIIRSENESYRVVPDIIINYNPPRALKERIVREISIPPESIERIIMLLGSTKIAKKREGLHAIYKYCLKLPFEYFITPHTRIAVISQREGNQEYTSLDISRVVGQAIIDRIINEYGIRPPVDLDYPDIAIYAEVMNDTFIVGIDTTWPYALHNRDYRKYIHPSSLRPTIAYALVKLSRARDKELILDPMCGGGTILIEATLTFPHLKAFGMDINQVFVKGAFKNVSAAGVKGRVILKVGDARILDKEFPNVEFDRIITDPQYGIRMRPRGLRKF